MDKALGERSTHELRSLASRVKAFPRAMTAEELAGFLNVSRLTILRRAKRGSIPSFRVGSCVRFDPANVARWLMDMGVTRMSKP
jgi:excisionase family DNA binding protein